jgi:hypothetical protein
MTPQTKATIQRIAAMLIGALLIGLVTAVLSHSNRITAIEVKVQNIVESQDDIKQALETNRKENNAQHERILDEIKGLRK